MCLRVSSCGEILADAGPICFDLLVAAIGLLVDRNKFGVI